MANCIDHIQCPSCAREGRDRSGNNLGVYDDGSKFCFRCRYYHSPTLAVVGQDRVEGCKTVGTGFTSSDRESAKPNRCTLPKDSIGLLDSNNEGLDWIFNYDLTTKEISDNLLLFSESGVWLEKKQELVKPLVIFPVYSDCELLMWTGRNLSYTQGASKWVIKGKKGNIIHGVYPEIFYSRVGDLSRCCVCEDIISTIKLGRIIPTYTLFGTSIGEDLLKYLSLNYSELLIYLDYDAVDVMLKLADRVKPYFSKVRVIISPLDPKSYSTEELRDIIK